MLPVLHFRRELAEPPAVRSVSGISARTMRVPADVPRWLALRDRAMAELMPRPRSWTEEDFRREMLEKPWWHDERTWLAFSQTAPEGELVGAVTLGERRGSAQHVPIIHWLLVDPAWRRRGIGRLLVSQLERAAWDAGWRAVELETHARWADAAAFYQSMGYAPVRERSPR